ncbi:transcription antitermination factor NusB [Aurantivibrio plasticivorans]
MSSPAARRKARHYAMQALYQWQLNNDAPHEIIAQFRAEYDMKHVDYEYLQELVRVGIDEGESLDTEFTPFLQGRSLNELDAITLALLRIATYELRSRIDVPFKVAINEAVSLAKKFGAADSHKFINAVLDQVATKLRSIEKGAQ